MIKDFQYFAPKTLAESLDLLSQYGKESKVIAGGQSLLILMRHGLIAPKYLIDIMCISALSYVRFEEKSGLLIGALTPHSDIQDSPVIQKRFTVLAEMEQKLASVQTRNWGTIGGNLCHADPAGDPAPSIIAMNGKLKLTSLRGNRVIAAENFAKDYFETVLECDELLTEIQLPSPQPRTGTSYAKISKREGDMAIVGAAVSITLHPTNHKCSQARIVLAAVAPIPTRARQAEQTLVGTEISSRLLTEAASMAAEEVNPIPDIHASAEYKKELVKVLVEQVGHEAIERAQRA